MEYGQRLISLLSRMLAACSSQLRFRVAITTTALLVGVPIVSNAAALKINDNVINLTGELRASVTHTAEGMAIEIPGVEISLECDKAVDPDNCTVTIGAGNGTGTGGTGSSATSGGTNSGSGGGTNSGSGGGTNSGSGGTNSGSGGDTDSDASDDDRCASGVGFGCQADGTQDGGSSNSSNDSSDSSNDSSDSSNDSSDSSNDTSDSSSSGGGYQAPETTSSSDPNDPCNAPGFNPACNSSGGSSSSAPVAFLTGAARVSDASASINFGSNGSQRNLRLVVPKAKVRVLGLSLASSGSSLGTVSFGPVGNIGGVDLAAWISSTPDGPRVSAGCGFKGYAEGVLRFSTNGSRACNLSPGGAYFLNLALCKTTDADLNCSASGATSAQGDSTLVVKSSYSN